MTARAAHDHGARESASPGADALPGLATLFVERATRTPSRTFLVDQTGREAWCGRPRIVWSYGAALPILERLAAFFGGLGLPKSAPVAVCLPGGSEAILTTLALEKAGLTACLLPIAWTRDELARAIETVGAVAVVTQTDVGALKPAETFRDIAMGFYGLRFVTAFGPQVPDGVVDLDRVVVAETPLFAGRSEEEGAGEPDDEPPEPALVTFARRGETIDAVQRTASSWVAAASDFLGVARYRPDERILSLVAPDDLAGLVTGLVAALVTGSALETHGLFDGPALAASLAEDTTTRLVAPGWMEPHLAAASLPARVSGIVLVHPAPTRFRARAGTGRPTVDVVALEPWALVTRPRGASGQAAIRLEEGDRARAGVVVRRDETGLLHVSGPGTLGRIVGRGGLEADPPHRRETAYRAEVFAGILIAVG